MARDLTRRDMLGLGIGACGLGLVIGLGCDDGGGEDGDETGGDVSSCAADIETNHDHSLSIPASDVNAGEGKTYTLTQGNGHTHTVVLSETDFERLMTDGTTRVESSSDAGHKHFVNVSCD